MTDLGVHSQMSANLDDDGVGWIELRNPERLNALGWSMAEALASAVEQISEAPTARCLVISGSGGTLSVGADLKERRALGDEDKLSHSRAVRAFVHAVADLPIPTVAVIDGFAIGGGLELALACDLRFGTIRSTFGFGEVKLGVLPGAGGTQRAARILGVAAAKDLLLTGRNIDSTEATQIGLLTRTLDDTDALWTEARGTAGHFARSAPRALRAIKACVDRGVELPMSEALMLEAAQGEALVGTTDYAEGLAAFAERRQPKFTGR